MPHDLSPQEEKQLIGLYNETVVQLVAVRLKADLLRMFRYKLQTLRILFLGRL